MIRHARLRLAAPVLALPVAMVQPSFDTPLMPAVGTASLLASCGGAAGEAAITLSAITVLTDPEHCVTSTAAANPLPENHFAVNRHARAPAGLDNGSRSWQVRTSMMRGDLLRVARPGPGRCNGRVPYPLPPWTKKLTPGARCMDVRRMIAPAAQMMLSSLRPEFRKRRFQTIDDNSYQNYMGAAVSAGRENILLQRPHCDDPKATSFRARQDHSGAGEVEQPPCMLLAPRNICTRLQRNRFLRWPSG